MPDLLREQFSHFRPIVEAFGYREPRVRGLGGGRRHRDARDARGRGRDQDVRRLHRPRRVPARLRERLPDDDAARRRGRPRVHARARRAALRDPARPDPGLHRAQGRHERQHSRRSPASGTRPPGSSIAQYGSRRRACSSTRASSRRHARGRSSEHAEQARASKLLATMRRDLELDIDLEDVVSRPPDRSQLKEIFRRFEFRALLGRVDTLDEALPGGRAAEGGVAVRRLARGELPKLRGSVGVRGRRRPRRGRDRRRGVVAPRPSDTAVTRRRRDSPCTTRRRCASSAADDTLIAAYLIDPGRAEYLLDDLAAENGFELEPEPPTEEETATLVRHAEASRRLAPLLRERVRERGLERLYDEIELPLSVGARGDGGRGRPHRHVPHGGDHRPALRPRRGARGARVRARGRGVRDRLADAARPHPLREARAHARPQGQDRLLDRRQGAARDPRRPRDRPDRRGVARADEAREHVPRAAADADRRGRAAAHDDQPARRRDRAALDVEPEPAGDPDPHRARARDPLRLRRGDRRTACSRPTTRRSSSGSSPTSPASRSCARRSSAARTSTPRPPRRCSARIRRR